MQGKQGVGEHFTHYFDGKYVSIPLTRGRTRCLLYSTIESFPNFPNRNIRNDDDEEEEGKKKKYSLENCFAFVNVLCK